MDATVVRGVYSVAGGHAMPDPVAPVKLALELCAVEFMTFAGDAAAAASNPFCEGTWETWTPVAFGVVFMLSGFTIGDLSAPGAA